MTRFLPTARKKPWRKKKNKQTNKNKENDAFQSLTMMTMYVISHRSSHKNVCFQSLENDR